MKTDTGYTPRANVMMIPPYWDVHSATQLTILKCIANQDADRAQMRMKLFERLAVNRAGVSSFTPPIGK